MISVIVPIYNAEKYLEECVESIINQSYQDMEIILVDNKSTDRSGAICDKFKAVDNRIKVIHREEHGWVSASRNSGIMEATGEWITFIDADDWIEKDCFQKVLEEINGRSMDIFFQGGHFLELPSKTIQKSNGLGNFEYSEKEEIQKLIYRIFAPGYGVKKDQYFVTLGAPWDKFYRTDFIKKNRIMYGEDILYLDDYYFNLKAFERADIVCVGTYVGYHYRQVSDSVMHRYRPDWPDKIDYVMDKVEKELGEMLLMNPEETQKVFNTYIVRGLLDMARGCYFHAENKTSYQERKKQMKIWCEEKRYKAALQENDDFLSKKQKCFKYFMKHHLYLLIEAYCKII